jgi:large subunit ribosomal protein L18
MDNSQKNRRRARINRVFRVRKNLHGSADKPRLSVTRTNCHLYAQLIDDDRSITLAGFGTVSMKGAGKSKATAKEIGKKIAEAAKQKNIDVVVFDRGRYKFHGLIAELANGAREAGLQF